MNPAYPGTKRTSTSCLLASFPLQTDTDLTSVPASTAGRGTILTQRGLKGGLTRARRPTGIISLLRGAARRDPFAVSAEALPARQAPENNGHLMALEHSRRSLRAIYYLITFLPRIAPGAVGTDHPPYNTQQHVQLLTPVSENGYEESARPSEQSHSFSVRQT